MTVFLHGVSNADVLAQLPPSDKPGSINASSVGLNTLVIDSWIQEGAAILNGTLERYGQDPASLTSNAAVMCKAAVINYALWKSMLLAKAAPRAELYKATWDETLSHLRKTPIDLGLSNPPQSEIKSNVPSRRGVSANPYGRDNFKGF